MLPIAHAADWISIALFVPVIVFMAWLALNQMKLRREQREGAEGAPHEP